MEKYPDEGFAEKAKGVISKYKKAFFFSLFFPGLGQIYRGKTFTGITFSLIFFAPFYYLFIVDPSPSYGSFLLVAVQLLFYVLQLFDAVRENTRETSPCEDACPANLGIPAFMAYIEEGKKEEALGSILSKIPFPFTLGEVCPAPCEERCGVLPERPLNIAGVHRELAREFLEKLTPERRPPFFPPVEKKVAVIGGGIAGLTVSYYLASCGVTVFLFEKEEKLGGVLNLVPDFKLDKRLFEREILFVTSFENIKVFTGTFVSLPLEGYDAVVVAVGCPVQRSLDVPVSGSPPIVYPVDFLKKTPDLKGRKVVILGGGNTAVDIARLVVRRGGRAFIFHRGSESSFRASPKDLRKAVEEGVVINANARLLSVEGNEAVFSGRRETFDYLVPALGFERDVKFLEGIEKMKTRVYLAGDVKEGASFTAKAVGSARNTARKVLKDLGLSERIWFSLDLYKPKPGRRIPESRDFVTAEASLCRHCGAFVKS